MRERATKTPAPSASDSQWGLGKDGLGITDGRRKSQPFPYLPHQLPDLKTGGRAVAGTAGENPPALTNHKQLPYTLVLPKSSHLTGRLLQVFKRVEHFQSAPYSNLQHLNLGSPCPALLTQIRNRLSSCPPTVYFIGRGHTEQSLRATPLILLSSKASQL